MKMKFNSDDMKYIKNLVVIYKDDLCVLTEVIHENECILENCDKENEMYYLYEINCHLIAKMIINNYVHKD